MNYEKVEVYRCVHCMDHYTLDEESMKEHVSNCLANPDNKACMMCKNCVRYNGIVDGKPDFVFKCDKKNQVLEQIDMQLTGAICFEKRDLPQIQHINSPEYNEYMEKLAGKIEKEMS